MKTHILKRKILALAGLLLLSASMIFSLPLLLVMTTRVSAEQLEPQSLPGELDPMFGIGGKINEAFLVGTEIAIQKDKKILVGGFGNLSLVRFNSNGTFDPTFGNGGQVAELIPSILDIALQADGRILVAGTYSTGGQTDFGLARYLADGSPDFSFGVNGVVSSDFFGLSDRANAIAIQSDGSIVIGGRAATGQNKTDFAVARYTANGIPDQGFGIGGKVTTVIQANGDPNYKDERIDDITVDANGRIVAVGTSSGTSACLRCQSNGLLDPSFANGGKYLNPIQTPNSANSVVIQADGRIVIGGSISFNNFDFMISRLLPDGTPDQSFGNSGFYTSDFNGKTDAGNGLLLLKDGRLLQVGTANKAAVNSSANRDFALICYTASGLPDNSFGEGGRVTTDFADKEDEAYAVALQSDARIVVVGRSIAASHGLGLAGYVLDGTAIDSPPQIQNVSIKGKKLIVTGANFESPTEIYVNGEKQKKVFNDESGPTTTVVAMKAGRFIAPGQTVTVQVKNTFTGKTSNEMAYTRPLQ
jgi:uncharacterized delta-60 repeat protein